MDPSQFWLPYWLLPPFIDLQLLFPPPPPLPFPLLPYGGPFQPTHHSQGPGYQQMGQQYHHYHPTVGPIRTERHRGHPMTVASQPYNYSHISSGMVLSNHSMGTHPAYAHMGPIYNTGAGGVGPPSGNPQMGSVQQTQHHHSGPPRIQKQQRGREDPSVYVVPVIESTTGGSAVTTAIPAPAPAPASTSAMSVQTAVSTPAASTSAQLVATLGTAETRRQQGGKIKKMRKRKVYDYDSDVHRVSSGSETDSD